MKRRAASSRACRAIRAGRRRPSEAYLAGNLSIVAAPERNAFLTRNLSEDGSRVFFQTQEALVPQDKNEQTDVYEWEREGAGGRRRLLTFERELQRKLRWLPVPDLDGRKRRSVLLRRRERRRRQRLLLHAPIARRSGSGRKRRPVRRARRRRHRRPEPARPRRAARAKAVSGPVDPPPVFAAPSSTTFAGAGNLAPQPAGQTQAADARAEAREGAEGCGGSRRSSGVHAKRGQEEIRQAGEEAIERSYGSVAVLGVARRVADGVAGVGMALAAREPGMGGRNLRGRKLCKLDCERKAVRVRGYPISRPARIPYAITTSITFNHVVTATEEEEPPRVRTYGDPKDIEVNLPPGVIVRSPRDRGEVHGGRAREPGGSGQLSKRRRRGGLLDLPRRRRSARRTGLQHGAPGGRAGRAGLRCRGDRADHARRGQAAHRRRLRPVGGHLRHTRRTPDLRPRAHAVGRPVGREPRPGTRPVRRRGSQTDLQDRPVSAAAVPWKGPPSRS